MSQNDVQKLENQNLILTLEYPVVELQIDPEVKAKSDKADNKNDDFQLLEK